MEKLESRLSEINIENQNVTADNKWGMPLKDLYRLGLSFYKGRCIRLFILGSSLGGPFQASKEKKKPSPQVVTVRFRY